MTKVYMPHALEKLAYGIVQQACEDYKVEYKKKCMGKVNNAFGIRTFFYSQWFHALCDFDSDKVVQELEQQVEKKLTKYEG